MRRHIFQTVGLCLVMTATLSGCLQATDDVVQTASRLPPPADPTTPADPLTGHTIGQAYGRVVAAKRNLPGEGATAAPSGLGPMIGASLLANGTMVYRHLSPARAATASTGYAEPAAEKMPYQRERLVYFLVGPDGVVRDWASGLAPGGAGNCFGSLQASTSGGYACADAGLKQAVVAMFDAAVKTRSGQPIGVWGPGAQPAVENGTN